MIGGEIEIPDGATTRELLAKHGIHNAMDIPNDQVAAWAEQIRPPTSGGWPTSTPRHERPAAGFTSKPNLARNPGMRLPDEYPEFV